MMTENKCPFCDEPKVRESVHGNTFRCGTLGPDINGEYSTGHVCDISTYTRLLRDKDAEINRLRGIIRELLPGIDDYWQELLSNQPLLHEAREAAKGGDS